MEFTDKTETPVFLDCLPPQIRREIIAISSHRRGGISSISEIHLCVGVASSMLCNGQRTRLFSHVSAEQVRQTLVRICSGAVYAYRDTISEGFVSMGGGVRVGIGAHARYSGGNLIGVSNASSLVFRIPSVHTSLLDRLYSAWKDTSRGMLIYSVAGGGKTTAIRDLSAFIAKKEKKRVAVIDERCEFIEKECSDAGVVLLRGYERKKGVEIALRTLAPEIIVIDELGARDESVGILESLLSGVKVLATAHAGCESELVRRTALSPYINAGVFDVLFGIFHTDNVYSYEKKKIIC